MHLQSLQDKHSGADGEKFALASFLVYIIVTSCQVCFRL